MKKALLSFGMLCYLLLTIGVSVNYHYCMNRLDSTQIFAGPSKLCGNCGMHTEKSNGCCRDEVKVVKVENDQKPTAEINFANPLPDLVAQAPSLFISTLFVNINRSESYSDTSPPDPADQDTYLKNCVFRI